MASTILFGCIQVSAGAYGSPQLRVHSLDLRRTTVNEKFDAVDEARVARCQEESYGCDLFRLAHFAAWNESLEAILRIGPEWVEGRSVYGARTENVHAN